MIPSNLIDGRRIAGLLLVALIAAGCGEGASVEQLLADARQQREKGNHRTAIIHLKDAAQKSPQHAEVRYLLGLSYNETGDYRSAEAELRRAVELGYEPARVMLPLGKALLGLDEYQKVLDQVRVAGDGSDAVQAEVLTLRAQALIALKRNREGRELLEQALARKPEFSAALLAQARLSASEWKMGEAMKLIDRAIAAAPNDISAWLLKGDLSRVVKAEDAEGAYQKALAINPESVGARLRIASLEIDRGRFDEARAQLDRAKKTAPGEFMIRYLGAVIELRKGNYAVARDQVFQLLKLAPDHLPSILLAGTVEYALGSDAQAQAHFARVLARAPGTLHARKLLVSSLVRTGNREAALETLASGLKQAPNDPGLLTLGGELAMQANDFTRARKYFEAAAKVDPGSAGARAGLAMSHIAAGEAQQGLANLEAAVELDSEKYYADVLLVTTHLQRKEFDEALKALQTLEKKQPNNPLTHHLKAAAYFGLKDVATAQSNLQRALELQPTYLPAVLTFVQLDLQRGDTKSARRRLEAVLEKDPRHAQALLTLADLGQRIGATTEEQIAWLERAHRASPGLVRVRLRLAGLYLQTGTPKKALELAQSVHAGNPNNAEALDMLAAVQTVMGEKQQALISYGRLVALQPKSPVPLFRLANAQLANGDAAGAAATVRKALALKPNFAEAQVLLTELEIRAGRTSEAMKIARQMQLQNAGSPVGIALQGDVLMAERKYLEAAKAYETAYRLSPNGQLAMKVHAAYTRGGKPEAGEKRLTRWLNASPDDVPVRLYAADISLREGEYRTAVEHYEWARRTQPNHVLMLNNLAWAYYKLNDPRALGAAERAYKLKPDSAEVADTLGWILVEQGDTKRGLEVLQKAVAAAPGATGIRYHLAQAWLKGGDRTRARDELEALLSGGARFPERDEAEKLLKQLRR